MSLLFIESFDAYATGTTADILAKWSRYTGSPDIEASSGRRSTQCLHIASSAADVQLDLPQAYSSLVIGFAYQVDALATGAASFLQLRDGGIVHLGVEINASGALEIYRGEHGTLLASSANSVISAATWQYIELKVTISDTVGSVVVRVNGVTVITATGSPAALDTDNSTTSSAIGTLVFTTAGANDSRYDDLYVLSTSGSRNYDFLGDVRVDCYLPNGNGTTSNLTGSDGNSTDNYLLVDETVPDDDTTYVQSSTVNDKDTYTFADMTHYPNAAQFFGVQVCAVGRKADVGMRSVGAVVRSSSTEVTGNARALDQSVWTGALLLQETDPAAASPNDWTRTSFNAAQFGVKVVA